MKNGGRGSAIFLFHTLEMKGASRISALHRQAATLKPIFTPYFCPGLVLEPPPKKRMQWKTLKKNYVPHRNSFYATLNTNRATNKNTTYMEVHKSYAQDTRFGQHEAQGGWSRCLPASVSMHTHTE